MVVSEKIRDCSSFNNFSCIQYLLNHQYRETSKYSPHAQSIQHLSTAIVRDLYLTHTHLGSRPFHQLLRSKFTMHASYLTICSRFTLIVAAFTEKNGGQTDGRTDTRTHTHRQTNCNNPRCACAQARVNCDWFTIVTQGRQRMIQNSRALHSNL